MMILLSQLDRYTASNKARRSMWLWSSFLPQSSYSPVKGLYLYGGVGTGKTMLMDLFFDQLPCNWRTKRIHFHDFMLNVHSRLQRHKGVADPLEVVAREICDESMLLCLDEFMEPISHVVARPSPNDILEWHYMLESSEGTPFAGGYYYGKIKFPPEYPYKPPRIRHQLCFTCSMNLNAMRSRSLDEAYLICRIVYVMRNFFNNIIQRG